MASSVTATRPFIHINQADLANGGETLNEKLREAAHHGMFYLEQPEECKKRLAVATEFAKAFPKDEKLKAIKLPGFSGYQDRKAQVESFYLHSDYWNGEIFSPELESLATGMAKLAQQVLNATLTAVDFPESDDLRGKATGNCSDGRGMKHFSFNNYRPERNPEAVDGIPAHKDFGQITVLYTSGPGLEVLEGKKWVQVPPKEGYFVVNFGRALEWLIGDKKHLIGAPHRVLPVKTPRISWGIFLDNAAESPIYTYKGAQLKQTHPSYQEYVSQSFDETYD